MGVAGLMAASFASCDDFLDDNRYPLSDQIANAAFWNNPNNVQGQINYFYEDFLGYGNSSGAGDFYFKYLSDDQAQGTSEAFVKQWTFTNIPTKADAWNDPYIEIRRANLIIEGVANSTMAQSDRDNFTAIARMMRGYQYYLLVRAYGDVPLIEKALDPVDEAELFGPRTPRNTVMDFAIDDLTYACENIATTASKNAFSSDLAKAIKTELCLFEASYARYHAKDEARAQKYYTEVVNVAAPLVAKYPIGDDYHAVYNSFRAALSSNSEIIFMKEYEPDVLMHCTVDYTSSSSPVAGMTKDAFDAYLFRDGKPLALTSLNRSDVGKQFPRMAADGKTQLKDDKGNPLFNYSILEPLSVRDGRLMAITDTAVYYDGLQYQRPNSMLMTSLTGYGVNKFNNPAMPESYTTTIKNYTCAPIYWGAYIAMNLVEAKAELGTLTDADLTNTMNKLMARADLPNVTVASMTAMNDPANNMGVSSLIWEVRRCRRCEFIFDKAIRYWDLVRWHQLELLDTQKHPNIGLGANVSAAPVAVANVNGYLNAIGNTSRVFTAREYFYPVPSGQIQLNSALTQNPGWASEDED